MTSAVRRRPTDHHEAAQSTADQDRSRKIYSDPSPNASQGELERRYLANRERKIRVGKCILAEQSKRHRPRFRIEVLRMREVEAVIHHRYGRFLPEHDGAEFLRPSLDRFKPMARRMSCTI